MLVTFFLLLSLGADGDAVVALGEQLFNDERFSSRQGDMSTGCASCHMETDPQGDRAFTQQLGKSWHPWRNQAPGRDTLRNTPTLLDVGLMPRLHFDGEFPSLEAQTEKTFIGRNFGWMPGERQAALDQTREVITGDDAYRRGFDAAFGRDVDGMNDDQMLSFIGVAVAKFMRTLRSKHDSLYDEFITLNGLPSAPAEDESAKSFGLRMMARLDSLERDGKVQRPSGFGRDAYHGMKVFFRTTGDDRSGNCVTCHVPPNFTDFAFHNTGMSQDEYDATHGSDAFAKLAIPNAQDATRPSENFMSMVDPVLTRKADLGLWNFIGIADNDDAKLTQAIASFKTPTLRHLASTDPYGHSGVYSTIETVLEQKMVAGFRARMGQLRSGDPEMTGIRISEEDFAPLFDFLNTLNSKGKRVARSTPLTIITEVSGRYYRDPTDPKEY